MTTRPLPPHGSLSRHKHYGCNCAPCHANYRAYEQRRRRLIGYGTWQPLTDAEPVRRHIASLTADGYSLRAIWQAADADAVTFQRLLYGTKGNPPAKKLRAETARRILAVRPADMQLSDHRPIDATGTRRRLQALMAIGWSISHLAPRLGMHPRPLLQLLHAERVYPATHRRVAAGYRRLHACDPATHGVPAQARTMARNRAAREGWASPVHWGEATIDDPNAQPDTDDTPTHESTRDVAAHRAEEIQHLARFGTPEHEIARRVGVTKGYVRAQLLGQRGPGRRQQPKEAA